MRNHLRMQRPFAILSTVIVAAVLCALPAVSGHAQTYPDRVVKIVVPFPPGGSADAIPRIIAEYLSRKWGQPVVIENRPGAAGNIGAEVVYRAPPDGYTLMSTPPPPLVMNQHLYPKLSFEPAQFEPIIIMAQVPSALLVNPVKINANSVPELINELKQRPGEITSATQGNGTTSHLTSEMFQMLGKVKLQQIPYRGSAPALQGLLAGDVHLMFDNLGVSLPLVEAGKLRLLGVATAQRLPSIPNVPTIAEILPGFESVAWFAIAAPPRTPKAIIDKINADANEALAQPDIKDKLGKLSAEVFGGSPEKAAAYMREEVARWGNVIKAANVTLQ
jgi:tripartite-type tricarboxylate transporter receptor subunit TctC